MDNIFCNLELDFDVNFAYSMQRFPMFLWDNDEFLDNLIKTNDGKYICFEDEIPKDMLMNFIQLEQYFLCTWFFHQKRSNKKFEFFSFNMIRNKKSSFEYLQLMTENNYLIFISRFASFVPSHNFRNGFYEGNFNFDIQTNVFADAVEESNYNSYENSFESYKTHENMFINFIRNETIASIIHRTILRIHMIQHSFRSEVKLGFLWFICMYIAIQDLLCLATWMELRMFSRRIYDLRDIDVKSKIEHRKQCVDLSLGVMSFGRGIIKMINIVADKIKGKDFLESLENDFLEIPPECIFGFVGIEIFRKGKEYYNIYARRIRKTCLSCELSYMLLPIIECYSPLDCNDKDYGCLVANANFSVIMTEDFIMFEGMSQTLCDPLRVIRSKTHCLQVNSYWIHECDNHTKLLTKIMYSAFQTGFEKRNIVNYYSMVYYPSIFPIKYKYLYDNSSFVTKIGKKFNNKCMHLIFYLYLNTLNTINESHNKIFIENMDQQIMMKILLITHHAFLTQSYLTKHFLMMISDLD